MNNAVLTVIILNYNQATLIVDAVESILAQTTNFTFHIIITDDYSQKDNSLEILRGYADKYPDQITLLLAEENEKTLANTLRALAITKTPYFTVLDGDDYLTDYAHLQKAIDFLEANPDFTIYTTNVTCLKEDGSKELYVKTEHAIYDSSFDDYLQDKSMYGQTAGMVMRNVIYGNGIPEIIEKAIGTISERSFEGETARFVMHLEKGKAHFVNTSCGVYRILSTGIWAGLNELDHHATHAQLTLDFNAYFCDRYKEFYVNKACFFVNQYAFSLFNISKNHASAPQLKEQTKYFNALQFCLQNKNLIKEKLPIKFRHKILLKLYTYCSRKLYRKGFISMLRFLAVQDINERSR